MMEPPTQAPPQDQAPQQQQAPPPPDPMDEARASLLNAVRQSADIGAGSSAEEAKNAGQGALAFAQALVALDRKSVV